MKDFVRHTFLLVAWLSFPFVASAQLVDWVVQFGDQNRTISRSLAIDKASNVFTIGSFNSSVDFDPGPGSQVINAVGNDLFITKQDTSGNLLWARSFSSDIDIILGLDVETDSQSNAYILGLFRGTIDADPTAGVDTIVSVGLTDLFLIKLDTAGELVWAKTIGNNGAVIRPFDLAIGPQNELAICGYFNDTIDFDPGSGDSSLFLGPGSLSFTEAAFVSRYDANGNFAWARRFGGDTFLSLEASHLGIDPYGNILVGGSFASTQDFNPGPDTLFFSSTGNDDLWLAKLGAQGQFRWARHYPSNANKFWAGIATDDLGNIYLGGRMAGSLDLDPGPDTALIQGIVNNEGFLTKLDSMGFYQWGYALKNNGTARVSGLSVDHNRLIYLVGEFTNNLDTDPGPDTVLLSAAGGVETFVGIYDSQGNFRSSRQLSASFGNEFARGIAVDSATNIYTTGTFNFTCDFNPKPNDTLILSPLGVEDVFVHRLIPCSPNFDTISQTSCDSLISPSGRQVWYQSGSFQDTLRNQDGCDSIITLNIVINPAPRDTVTLNGCDSLFVSSGVGWVFSSGLYNDTIPISPSCNRVRTYNVDIRFTQRDSLALSVCDSLLSPSGKHLYLSSGFFTDTLSASSGCDSIIYIDLTVNLSSLDTNLVTACDSSLLPGGAFANSGGLYLDSLISTKGCDSIIYTDLSLSFSQQNLVIDSACGWYSSPSGRFLWTSSGTYFDTLSTARGCDSILEFQLSIFPQNRDTLSLQSCGDLLSPSGRYLYLQSGLYNDTLINSQGCDSIITINLTVNRIDTSLVIFGDSIFSNQTGAAYQWLDCNNSLTPISGATQAFFKPAVNGLYAVEIRTNACVDTSNCVLINNVDLPRPLMVHPSLYPSPFKESFTFDPGSMGGDYELRLLDLQGKLIERRIHRGKQKMFWQPEIAAGLYFLVWRVDDEYGSLRLIKE